MSSDYEELFDEKLESLYRTASRPFAVMIKFDSTGGRFRLQPLSARPWLKVLLVLACFPVFGTLALIIHFNVGTIWSVLFVIAVLWFFAELRSRPLAPDQLEVTLHKTGRMKIESERGRIEAHYVGPIWEKNGLVLAVVHEHAKFEELLDEGDSNLLHHLQHRARLLGVDSWKVSDLDDKTRTLLPNTKEDDDSGDEAWIRNSFRHVFEHARKDPPNFIVVLGRPVSPDRQEPAEEYDELLSKFNVVALRNLSRWLSVE